MIDPPKAPPSEKDLLLATIDMPTDQRSEYLNAACGSNIDLKARVNDLLKNAETGGSFMASPAVDINRTTAMSSISVGGQIGRYRLMEQLGEGGMGVVYVAEQLEPVRRKVALKVIKPGMDSKQVIARFDAERQALAMMDHSNIARVFDAGTTDQGLPYFVMELVRGMSITKYCDQAKLSTNERLALFIEVCGAVQHAHQKGIIHRDIKPGNVLVTLHDGKPVVKVIDFGVAKAIHQQLSHHSVYTALNQIVGTPLYMSPEQLELSGLDIDTRSDIYSLGVLLYELLTGDTPFDRERLLQSGFDEMRRIIREEEPPRPSQRVTTMPKAELSTIASKRGLDERAFTKSVQSELDWITLKTLEKDRKRRYESASALGADVQRFLDDEPVLACPPSVAYRAKKLMRRHRVLLTTTTLVLVASLVGTSVSIWQTIKANESKRQAVASNVIARKAVDDMYTQFAEKWLSEEGNASPVQREFLEKAMLFYESTAMQDTNDRSLDLERMKVRERVARMQFKLGEFQEAEANLVKVIQECQDQVRSNPSVSEFAIIELRSLNTLAFLLESIGKRDASGDKLKQAATKLEILAANKSLDSLDKSGLANVSAKLATNMQIANQRKESEKAIQIAIQLWQDLLSVDPTSWDNRVGLANALERQGVQRMWFGDRQEEAKTAFVESKERLLQLLQERPRDRTCRTTLSRVHISLGVLASWANQNSQAIELRKEGIAISKDLIEDYPTDQDALSSMNKLLWGQHNSLQKSGSIDESKEVLKQIFESSEKLIDLFPTVITFVDSYRVAGKLSSLALHNSGDHVRALGIAKRYRDRIEYISHLDVSDHVDDLRSHANSATLEYVALLLEDGLCLDAITELEKIEFDLFEFKPEGLTRNSPVFAEERFLSSCNDYFWYLQRPCTMIRECIELLEQDASLTQSEKRERTTNLRGTAEHCEAEAQKVYDAWKEKLKSATLSSDSIISVYTSIMKKENSLRTEKRLHRETSGLLALDLFHKLDDLNQDAKPNDLSFMIGELTAGEDYQRDPELALRLAKRAVEMKPKSGMARQDLAWALYRNGQYEESLSLQGSNIPRVDPTESAILAMTLWQVGRKEEAAACLDAPYEEKLTKYTADQAKGVAEGRHSWPIAANLLRLDREAKALLGNEREALAVAFDVSVSKSDAVATTSPVKTDATQALRVIAQWQYDNLSNEAAEESLSELIRRQPDSGDRSLWGLRGTSRARLERFEEAISDFDYVLETAPHDTGALSGRSNSNVSLGQYAAALTDATKLIEIDPTYYVRYFRRAEIYLKLGKPGEALADIKQGFDIAAGVFKPHYAMSEAFALRGQVYLEGVKDSEQAISDFTNALQQNLFSGNVFTKQDVYLLRAAAHDAQGEPLKAEQDRAAAKR